MPEMTPTSDHDILIGISIGQADIKSDMRALADGMKELKLAIDATNQRQSDLENRMTNLSGTVQRSLIDQRDDHKEISTMKTDHLRWRLYMKVALILLTPIYLIILALIIEASKKFLFP